MGFASGNEHSIGGIDVVAWAFQTLWGGEVAVRIAVSKCVREGSDGFGMTWKGTADVRASNQHDIDRVVRDFDHMLFAMSSGLLRRGSGEGSISVSLACISPMTALITDSTHMNTSPLEADRENSSWLTPRRIWEDRVLHSISTHP